MMWMSVLAKKRKHPENTTYRKPKQYYIKM